MIYLAPLAAFMFYGGWSGWLNWMANNPAWLIPAISHGSYAFIVTLLLRWLALKLYARFAHFSYARLLTFMVMGAVIILLPLVNQKLAGNSRIGLTLLPGVVIGMMYLWGVIRQAAVMRASDRTPFMNRND